MQGNFKKKTWTEIHLYAHDCDEMRMKVSEFEAKFGMIQAMGCIDGTHVPLKSHTRTCKIIFVMSNFIH